MVEQLICNQQVGGSIPFAGSIYQYGLSKLPDNPDKVTIEIFRDLQSLMLMQVT